MDIRIPDRIVEMSADRMPGGFMIYRDNESEEIIYVNDKFLEILGCESLDDVTASYGKGFKDIVYYRDIKNVEASIYNQIVQGFNTFDHVNYRVCNKAGKLKYIEHYGQLVEDEELGRVFYVFLIDTDTKHITYELNRLTGLPGMHRFYEFSKKLLDLNALNPNAQSFSIAYFNINHFSSVNLKYGVKAGDEFLLNVAQILKHIFPDDFLAHLSNDRFAVLTESEGLSSRITYVRNLIKQQTADLKTELKAGIYNFEDNSISPEKACGYAQFACDSIKERPSVYVAVYDEKMMHEFEQRQFVVDNIDNAVKSGHIEAFYQPVVRTLSQKVCSVEALARWRDPERGLLSPAVFISALEDSRLIHKLDCCMIELICQNYRRLVDRGERPIPVSFNLSRIDFLLCDIFRFVDDTVTKYDVPKKMLRIEITESVIISEYDYITSVIDKFRAAGFEIWMDDFGSGYSSLNVLKDFAFDKLKIDMLFLSTFNQKTKDILMSIVRMSKIINVDTLAEGVETEEQFEFLKNIGCETVQGFWFGRPLPYDQTIEHIRNRGLVIEEDYEEEFYDPAGKEDFLTDVSMSLIYDDGKHFRYLFANDRHKALLKSLGLNDTKFVEKMVNSNLTPFSPAIREFIRKPARSRNREELYYTAHGRYIRILVRTLSEHNGHYIHKLRASDMTHNVDAEKSDELDNALRSLFQLYKAVYQIDLDNRRSKRLFSNSYVASKTADEAGSVEFRNEYTGYLHPADRQRYVEFANKDNIISRIDVSKNGYISDCFRTVNAKGEYEWTLHTILCRPNASGREYLYCVADIITDDTPLSVRHDKMLSRLYDT